MRTRPSDRRRVLVSEADAKLIEEQWSANQDAFKETEYGDREALEQERQHLRVKFGGPPSDADVWWSLLNKRQAAYSAQEQWGLYRNARLKMAAVLYADGRREAAFDTYLEILYLDLNRPWNRGNVTDPRILAKYPRFQPERAFIAPAIVSKLKDFIKSLAFDRHTVLMRFLDHARQNCAHIELPLSPPEAWTKMEPILFGPEREGLSP